MKSLLNRKTLLLAFILVFIASTFFANLVSAQNYSTYNPVTGESGDAQKDINIAAGAASPGSNFLNPLNWAGFAVNEILNRLIWGVVYFIGYIAGAVFVLGGSLISFALELNSQVLNLEIVHAGWAITRDVANLGFVLGILVISFATIIRQQQYGLRQLLVKFIVMALLINFSLVIAGVILDFAGLLTVYFANAGLAEDQSWHAFSSNLANLSQVDQLKNVGQEGYALSETAANLTVQLSSLIFVVAFTVLAAIVFLGIALMFLARFIHLVFLLILAPLAWFTGIFPRLNQSSRWWSSFIRWTFFAPVSMFFLFLAVTALSDTQSGGLAFNNQGSQVALLTATAEADQNWSQNTILAPTLSQLGTMIVVLGFMVASLLVGQKMGISGASLAMGWAKGFQGWATGKIRAGAARGALAAARGASRALGLEEQAKKWEEQAQKGEGRFRRVKSLAARTVIRPLEKSAGRDYLENAKKDVVKLDTDQVALQYATTIDPARRAAMIEFMAEKKALHKLPKIDMDLYKKYGGDMGKLTKANPLLYEDKDDAKNVAKQLRDRDLNGFAAAIANKLKSMSPEDFSNIMLAKIIKGLNLNTLGLSEKDWKQGGYQNAFLKAVSENIKGKEIGKALQKSSISERHEVANRLIASILDLDSQTIAQILNVSVDQVDNSLKSINLLEVLDAEFSSRLAANNKKLKEANQNLKRLSNELATAKLPEAKAAKEKELNELQASIEQLNNESGRLQEEAYGSKVEKANKALYDFIKKSMDSISYDTESSAPNPASA